MKHSKVIDIEDFSDKALLPFLREIAEIEMRIFGIEKPQVIPDSKNWETAMALYGFEKAGVLKPGKVFAGIGAGTELLTELLASRGSVVLPVDRYLENTPWSDVAPSGYMVSTEGYLYNPQHAKNIIPVHSDARSLELPSNFFDAVYSSGSIEHFGSLEGVEAAAVEIGRILKPGGVASISTEFRLDGPEGVRWFNDSCILFTPELITKHIVEVSGLSLIDGAFNERPSAKTFETRRGLVDFLNLAKNIKTFEDKTAAYPNLVLSHNGFLFCSVHILLQKPDAGSTTARDYSTSQHIVDEVRDNNKLAINKLNSVVLGNAKITNVPGNDTSGKGRASKVAKLRFLKRLNSLLCKYAPGLRGRLLGFISKSPRLASWLYRNYNK